MNGRNEDRNRHKPAPRRPVKGGIRAQSQKGSFSATWWGQKWIQTLESFPVSARLERGRTYARSGQVAELRIENGTVTARVQGSRRNAYRVTISLPHWPKEKWSMAAGRLREKPWLTAQLLANEMPEDIESIFGALGLPIFPRRQSDLRSDCSCPDWSNPCKHIAAVYYLIAEALDRDPFILFALHGMDRDELMAAFQGVDAASEHNQRPSAAIEKPLPLNAAEFWGEAAAAAPPSPAPRRPELTAALPRRLGPLSFWRSRRIFLAEMQRIYANASELAQTALAED